MVRQRRISEMYNHTLVIVYIAHCVKRSGCPNFTRWEQASNEDQTAIGWLYNHFAIPVTTVPNSGVIGFRLADRNGLWLAETSFSKRLTATPSPAISNVSGSCSYRTMVFVAPPARNTPQGAMAYCGPLLNWAPKSQKPNAALSRKVGSAVPREFARVWPACTVV